MKFTSERIAKISKSFEGKRIAVVGDMMLDCYFWGIVKRISPEAPVPVVEIDDEFFRFGGAANVALNIFKLGGIPIPYGVIGNDNDGEIFKKLINDNGITSEGIIIDNSRPTTAKTRVIAEKQHIVRIDKESKSEINSDVEEQIFNSIKKNKVSLDAIILQDYNKGVLSIGLIKKIVEFAAANKIIITVDPKFDNFFEYQGVTLFKPNKKETEDKLGIKIMNDNDITAAGFELIKKLNSRYVLLTLGEKGVALFDGESETEHRIPTKARKVSDVSGAGDTVISTLTMALTAGCDVYEASYLANYAGGIVCEEVGIVPVEKEKLFEAIAKENDLKGSPAK